MTGQPGSKVAGLLNEQRCVRLHSQALFRLLGVFNLKQQMAVVQVPVERLIPYARNSRTHSDAQVAQIAASIREFGWTNPILVDGARGIIAGHGRVLAARKLGEDSVPCIELAGLTDNQKRAYIIADNKLALNAGWDTEMLALELNDLKEFEFDTALTGFTAQEMSNLNGEGVDFSAGSEDDQGKLGELAPKIVTCPHCQHVFDSRDA